MIATRRRLSLVGAASLALAAALGGALAACGEVGVTPDCPPLPLYSVRDAGWRTDPEVLDARAAAVDAGCLTELGDAQPGAD